MEKRKVLRHRSIDKDAEKAKRRKTLLTTISKIIKKGEDDMTQEEIDLLEDNDQIVQDLRARQSKGIEQRDRIKETEDDLEVLKKKCVKLAEAIHRAKRLVVYTGAGISTSANIPDYRGPNGVWTLLDQGKEVAACDLGLAQPTTAHMALFMLYKQGKISHIVSQNCDGLHLRSGIPRSKLSEVHGNMFIEVCKTCKPVRPYVRLFDVTERTNRFRHSTRRRCYICGSVLIDTIVHFGERGSISWPINWNGASRAAEKADMILCLGSSLKVLRRYPWLWCMDRQAKQRPPLYIVNLQWTPKDSAATLKLNGRCDFVLNEVLKNLRMRLPEYTPYNDPLLSYATHLNEREEHTTSRRTLIESRPVGVKHISMEARVSDNGIIKEVRCETRFSTPSDNFRGRSSSTEEMPRSPAAANSSSSSSESSGSNSSSSSSKSSSNSSSNASSRNSSSDRSGKDSDQASAANLNGSSSRGSEHSVNRRNPQSKLLTTEVDGISRLHSSLTEISCDRTEYSLISVKGEYSTKLSVKEEHSTKLSVKEENSTELSVKENHSTELSVKEENSTELSLKENQSTELSVNGGHEAELSLKREYASEVSVKELISEVSVKDRVSEVFVKKESESEFSVKDRVSEVSVKDRVSEVSVKDLVSEVSVKDLVSEVSTRVERDQLTMCQNSVKICEESLSCDIKTETQISKESSPFPSPDHTYAISPHKLEKEAIPNILEYVKVQDATDENAEIPKNRRYGLREKRVQKYSKFDEEYFIQCQEQILKAVNTKKQKEEKVGKVCRRRPEKGTRPEPDKTEMPKGKIKEVEYRTLDWNKDALYFSYEPNFLFLDDDSDGFVCECCDPGSRLDSLASIDPLKDPGSRLGQLARIDPLKKASSSEENSEVEQETPEDDESCPEGETSFPEETKPHAPGWFGKGRRKKGRTKFRA